MRRYSFQTRIRALAAALLVVLSIVAVVGVVAVRTLGAVFTEYRMITQQTTAVNGALEDLLEARIASLKFRIEPAAEVIDEVRDNIDELIELGELPIIQKIGDLTTVQRLTYLALSYEAAFERLVQYRAQRDLLIERLRVVGPETLLQLNRLADNARATGNAQAWRRSSWALMEMMHLKLHTDRFLFLGEPQSDSKAERDYQKLLAHLGRMASLDGARGFSQMISTAREQIFEHKTVYSEIKQLNTVIYAIRTQELDYLGPRLTKSYDDMLDALVEQQAQLGPIGARTVDRSVVAVVVIAVAAVLGGVAAAFLIGGGIRAELRQTTDTLNRMAERDYSVPILDAAEGTEMSAIAKALNVFKEIEQQALQDQLTGLSNRRSLELTVERLERAALAGEGPYAILHLDLDFFKKINDTLGHAAGDHVLKCVAGILTKSLRASDRAYRIGGDEFIITVEGAVDKDEIGALCQRIIDQIEKPIFFDGQSCKVGMSIGIAFASGADNIAQITWENADNALYQAKSRGRNTFVFFDDQDTVDEQNAVRIERQIYRGIENCEFVPYYQPQFYAGDMSLRGVEVLCRWRHPEQGVLAPGAFMDAIKKMRILSKIEDQIFEKVGHDLIDLRAMGLDVYNVSLNITEERMLTAGLAEHLRSMVGPDVRLSIEFLESISMDEIDDHTRMVIDGLRDAGISIEIDDFGSCRASIAGLISVSPDAMKIDRSIVAPVTGSEQHRRTIKAIIEIGAMLNIEVIAEGVETDLHVSLLRQMGCTVLQGYGLARPMPADELAAFLRKTQESPRLAV